MRRLRIFIIAFCLALLVPLAYFVLHTFRSLEQEEEAELRYFSETLFDRLEGELAGLVRREEARALDEYAPLVLLPGQQADQAAGKPSPLSRPPADNFILGYFQNGPDGAMQTPHLENVEPPSSRAVLLDELRTMNSLFNRQRTKKVEPAEPEAVAQPAVAPEKKDGLVSKYFRAAPAAKQKARLGQEVERLEEISPAQARKIAEPQAPAASEQNRLAAKAEMPPPAVSESATGGFGAIGSTVTSQAKEKGLLDRARFDVDAAGKAADKPATPEVFQAEVAPLQAVLLDERHLFLFRRVIVGNVVYRQGLVIKLQEFLDHLLTGYFRDQPLAAFTSLRLSVAAPGGGGISQAAGAAVAAPVFTASRVFPRPFSFLQASLDCQNIPPSSGRLTLQVMMVVLAGVVFLGLFAIYQSARVVVDLSERRAGFVSSVTHELKTPLTTIRMYIEMLEQGIAGSREREQDYYRILESETGRLTRLINNVLEFSRLERRQRPLVMQAGTLDDVHREVKNIMAEKLRQEGFEYKVEQDQLAPFSYDREAMVQILINLLDNSMKFGRDGQGRSITLRVRQDVKQTVLEFSDTGPGISRHALKKIFDDFYREDNSLTRRTQGTGIGLALVRRLVAAMGGRVAAANNPDRGCTVTISLPRQG